MATQIGRFELLSEIAKSERGAIYKANDSTNGQTVALKTLRLEMPAEQAQALVERVEAESQTINGLNSPNLAQLYGAGELDNVLCAAMEYIQGNSISTMLARKEGFSIWDLLDISRQVCLGLDHAHAHGIMHHSFEPAKVMVQWDGTVKILGFGISQMGLLDPPPSGKVPAILYYASPEQLSGEALDARSNLYSWGAILYEMVTDQKAFAGENSDIVRQQILQGDPIPPAELNQKIHPAVNDLIMKALSKNRDERFQNGQLLVTELEKCKQASMQAAKKGAVPPQGLIAPNKVTPTSKPGVPAATPASPGKALASPARKAAIPNQSVPHTRDEDSPLDDTGSIPAAQPTPAAAKPPLKRAAAAAAGNSPTGPSARSRAPQLDPSAQFKGAAAKTAAQSHADQATLSAAPAETDAPRKFAVDPMMAEGAAGSKPASFSDLEEMPPLKEVHVAPPAPPAAPPETAESALRLAARKGEAAKPKVQPRVAAKQAIKEIKSVPPRLMMYSIAAAVALVMVIAVGLVFRIHSQNADDEGTPAAASSVPAAPSQSSPPQAAQSATAPVEAAPQIEAAPVVEVAPVITPRPKRKAARVPARPAIVPGQLAIDSTPQGAQVQVDGRGDPSWVTPLSVTSLAPGRHTVTIGKNGYVSETRAVEVGSGSKAVVLLHLAAAAGTISVRSEPAGASVFVDGRDSGRVTPAQISVEKGNHVVLVRKQGYLDETTTANLQPGQSYHFSPALRPLGNADDIKTVGKFKKIFRGGDTAGMGSVSIKTQPKGAQIAVNRRMLDKASPVQFMIGPGNYIIDISASGYKPIHRIINVDKGGKVSLDEAMQPE
jgi:serine/threonine protein kinase